MRDTHYHADRETSALTRAAERLIRARLLERPHPGDSATERLVLRARDRRVALGRGRRRNGPIGELVRPLLTDPGRLAPSDAKAHAALGHRGARAHPRGAQGGRVEPT